MQVTYKKKVINKLCTKQAMCICDQEPAPHPNLHQHYSHKENIILERKWLQFVLWGRFHIHTHHILSSIMYAKKVLIVRIVNELYYLWAQLLVSELL